jgi:starch synthase
MPVRVLFVASECAPFVKTGGLADVVASLPPALRALGHDVRLLVPGYPAVLAGIGATREVGTIAPFAGLPGARLVGGATPGGVPLLAVVNDDLYDRPGGPYQDADGRDHADNARRFGLLSHVAAAVASPGSPIRWKPQLLHANDWQSGLAPAYLALWGGARASSVVTIHNLAFHGSFEPHWLGPLGIPASAFAMHGVEFHGRVSFLKAGLYYADAITTVSPTYAREIQSEPLGMGLDGLLAARSADLSGILNGIDDATWDPASDPLIPARYRATTLWRKAANKAALQEECGLAVREDVPLLALVSRLTHQKGVDLLLGIADELAAVPVQLVVLGTGERELADAIAALPGRFPGVIAARIGFDEALAHRIEAGADAFLMPSRFEPCGMNQMYSQRYGTPPIVRATGGLADSVVDCTPDSLADGSATGFTFADATPDALWSAIARAIALWHRPRLWRRLQRNAMARDFGWARAATDYARLYRALVARRPGPSARG